MASPPPSDGSAALVAHLATFPDDVPLQGILRAMRDWSPAQRSNFAGAMRACFPEACADGGWPNIRDENARLRADNERLRNEQPWRGVFNWGP